MHSCEPARVGRSREGTGAGTSAASAAAGYDTVNLDDGWMASSRTSDGSLTWDTTKFPNGIPWLASQIHALGLKFGIYEAIGTRTCQKLPGSGGGARAAAVVAADARLSEIVAERTEFLAEVLPYRPGEFICVSSRPCARSCMD
jgi:hypothetical protein